MITSWDIYLLTRLDDIKRAFDFFGFVGGVLCWIFYLIVITGKSEVLVSWEMVSKKAFKAAIVFTALFIIAAILPNTKQMVAIKFIPKIANNETVQEIPSNAAEFINEQLKAWVEDLKEKK